jgi:hypothetical protein
MKTVIQIAIATLLVMQATLVLAQKQAASTYQVSCIGFYNLENLFDPSDDPLIKDEEFTPTGSKLYSEAIFRDKLNNLSKVLGMVGAEQTKDGLAIIGVAEVENKYVLDELVKQPELVSRNYQVVHYNSPDERGIDVGLLYNPSYFKVLKTGSLNVPLKDDDGSDRKTRDILWVYGLFKGEAMHVFVNHWPSRRGGEEISAPGRALAASVCRAKVDSIMNASPSHKILVMGDLNDDPVNKSLVEVMKSEGTQANLEPGEMYNPWEAYYKKGIGTLAYNDAWNLFDQIIMSQNLLNREQQGFFYKEAVIFNRPFLVQKSGRYKGYPLRTYDFDIYMRGYSDHLPVYLVLIKQQTAVQ